MMSDLAQKPKVTESNLLMRSRSLLAVVAVCCLLLFVVYSNIYVAIGCLLLCVGASRWQKCGGQQRLSVQDRAVVVTGCDTGFGHHLAKQLSSLGVMVFAGCLHSTGEGATTLKRLGHTNLHVVQMDVTCEKEIQETLDKVKQTVGDKGLWGIVNNAGLNFIGDIELNTMEQIERVMNINQLGMVRVTKAFLPLLRNSKGRVVNVTSCQGRIAIIYNAPYAMSKFAGEAFSDILRMEMKKFGIKVVIVEPGNFASITDSLEPIRIERDFQTMWDNMSPELQETYGKEYVFHHTTRAKQGTESTACRDISLVTNVMVDALFLGNPKPRYLIGGSNQWYDKYTFWTKLYPFLPTWYLDGLLLHDARGMPVPKALLNQ